MWVIIIAFIVFCYNIVRIFSLNILAARIKKSRFLLGEKGHATVVAHRGSRSEGITI